MSPLKPETPTADPSRYGSKPDADQSAGGRTVQLRRSLQFKILAGLVLTFLVLTGAITAALWVEGRKVLAEEARRLQEQSGLQLASDLEDWLTLAKTLAGSLANLGETLPREDDLFMRIVPRVLDREGCAHLIAGGGIWPEPGAFQAGIERRSFFWGRNAQGRLEYYDDYNDPKGAGYHNEEWYVPARHVSPAAGYWSKSYVDLYSGQPMVTCSVPMISDGRFEGVTTVDLKLEGLRDLLARKMEASGGYELIVDRNNRFVSFPDEDLVGVSSGTGEADSSEYVLVSDLAARAPWFAPVAQALAEVNDRILAEARGRAPDFDDLAADIASRSNQIEEAEAQMIAAVVSVEGALATGAPQSLTWLELSDDALLGEPSTVTIIHMPETHWKIATVIPVSRGTADAVTITRRVGTLMVVIVSAVGIVSFFVTRRVLIRPLSRMTSDLRRIATGQSEVMAFLDAASQDEMGTLAYWFNQRTARLTDALRDLQAMKDSLEQRVEERTAELAAAEERSRLILESTREGIFGVDTDGVVTFINASAAKTLGYGREEVLGKAVHPLIHHSYADGRPYPLGECPMNRAFTEGAASHVDDEVLWRKDGTRFDVEYTAVPVRKGGDIIGAVVVFRDVTELVALYRDFVAVLEHSADFVYIKDANHRFTAVSQNFAELAGQEHWRGLVGKSDFDVFPREHAERYYERERPVLAGGEEIVDEVEPYHDRKGELRWVKTNKRPIRDRHGNIIGLFGISTDITEFKRLNEELQEAKEAADAANRAKSEFLSNMSHELRTPLNGVLGYAQLLQRDPALSKRQKESLDAIQNCGEHLLTLINDVLDLSKIEAGLLEIDRQPCDFHRLLKSVFDIVRPRAEGKGLTISLNLSPEVPVAMLTDPTKLKQTLVNLLGNAVKFTEKGAVTLDVCESGSGMLEMHVCDTGVGMTQEELAHIFDPFKQVAAGKAAGGTGLGLTISKRIIEALGGALTVESTPGEGSCFTITHPLVEASDEDVSVLVQEESAELDQPVLAPGQDVTVLVADDRETNRHILVELLKASGFKTMEAANGEEALAVLRKERCPLVLMDVRMPVMSGVEATRIIREDPELRDTVVIAVTASVFPEFRDKAKEAGFDDFLGKPLRASELYGRIRHHLGVRFEEQASEADAQADAALLQPLPRETGRDIAQRIRNAAENGDVSELTALADELSARTDAGSRLGKRVAELAQAFDFDGLARLAQETEEAAP
ncbi:MAG: PAS domain S-box protein [Phycisphaerales bacterium]|nr:MAG: PAS domain S-box protein [Phycisphaerales bacterium]